MSSYWPKNYWPSVVVATASAPKRQQILDAVKARLQTILIAGGYKTDMGSNVFVQKETPFTDAEIEGIDVRYSDTPDQQIGYEEHTLAVECMCVLSGNDPTTNVNNAGADIVTVIGTDRTWGGLAEETGVVTAERANIAVGENVYQGASVKFDVTYTTDHMNAYS